MKTKTKAGKRSARFRVEIVENPNNINVVLRRTRPSADRLQCEDRSHREEGPRNLKKILDEQKAKGETKTADESRGGGRDRAPS